MNQQPNGENGNGQPPKDHGKQIGDIVRTAFQSGDLSRLKDLGPAVSNAVTDFTKTNFEVRGEGNVPAAQTGRKAAGKQSKGPNYTQPGAPNYQHMSYPYDSRQYHQPKPPAPVQNRGKTMFPKGIFRVVFGVLGMVAFGLCALTFAALALIMPLKAVFWPLSIACAAAFGGSGVLTASGVSKNRLAARAQQYYGLLEKKKAMSYEDLAAEVGRTPKQIKKDLRKMKAKGWMLDVRTDAADHTLMLGEDTYKQYLESVKSEEQKKAEAERKKSLMADPEKAALEEFRDAGVETIRKIRSANEAIPGEEISDKLSRLEATCARIFTYVEAHPDKLPDTRRFMDYYLPTTLKLVEKYRQYEEMDFQPDNVKDAKVQIEKSLDTIDIAFKNLLESLFAHDTLDVSTDIVTLKQVLEQEGLTGKKFEIDEGGAISLSLSAEPESAPPPPKNTEQ